MMKNVLVTGANGQLGTTIKELFNENDIGLKFVFVSKEDLDITKKTDLTAFFKNKSFHYCINCAAYTNVEQAEKTPEIAYMVNAVGIENLSYACEENNIILIHISTDYVFDGEKEEPYNVNDETNPINEYGKSKLEGEKHIKKILTKYFIIRTSWLFSKKYGNNFYKTILKKAKTEKELLVTTEQKGCPTDAVNLSKFIIKLMNGNSNKFGVVHFCDEKVMTWYDFAEEILIENNLYHNVNLVKGQNYCTLARRPKNSALKNWE